MDNVLKAAWIGLCLCVFQGGLAAVDLAASETAPGSDAVASETEVRLAKLIEQLGADDFSQRERAQADLAQLGLEAFDALHAAQNHHDPEISLRARYLVRSMSVRWFSESDSPEVVRILQGYGDLQEGERRNRMDKLAMLENRQGVVSLCRLSRYETLDPLAKYAALKIMSLGAPEGVAGKDELVKSIQSIVGSSKRVAASWLRLFALTLTEPVATLPEWDRAAQAEHLALAKTPERTRTEIVRDLYRFQVELLKRLKQDAQAIEVIRRTFELLDGTPEQLQEIVDWLLQNKAWVVVLEVGQKFSMTLDDNPQLLYCVAESHQRLGQTQEAEAAAQKALAIRPENLDAHLRIGVLLEHERGLSTWAEREYREVLKTAAPGSATEFTGRFYLSELLHDQFKELAAAEALVPLCEQFKKDEAAKETSRDRAGRTAEEVIARMNYFYACHYREQKDSAKVRQHLQTAIDAEPTDADVLIAMYRLEDADDAYKANVKERIERTAADFRSQVEELRTAIEMTANDQSQPEVNYELARLCNQYAWLVGNTIGNYDEAVKLSRKSLELRPNYAGFLDTLGRCYYAKADYLNAVKYQAQAAKLNFYSGQIRKQLEFFVQEAKAHGVTLPEEQP